MNRDMNTVYQSLLILACLSTLTRTSAVTSPTSDNNNDNRRNHYKRSVSEGALDTSSRAAVHRCALARDGGWCSDHETRWYFDTEYGDCLQFWYGGCDGNANRFSTEGECVHACRQPGDRRVTCQLPPVAGPCSSTRHVWYYDASRSACDTFVYSGCLGNDNRYDSREECESTCGDLQFGDNLDEQRMSAHQHTHHGDYTTERGSGDDQHIIHQHHHHYHHPVHTTTLTTTVPPTIITTTPITQHNHIPTSAPVDHPEEVTGAASDASVCQLEDRQPGECDRYIVRYSHVRAYRQCAPFYYSGCGGNANNFASLAECQHTCSVPSRRQPQQKHQQERPNDDEGHAEDSRDNTPSHRDHRWLGVLQRTFISHTDHQARDQTTDDDSTVHPSAPSIPPEVNRRTRPVTEITRSTGGGGGVDLPQRCWPDKDGGPCFQYLHRYFYDRQLGQCRQFIYGGCHGNNNRFDTLVECQQYCEVLDPKTQEHQEKEGKWLPLLSPVDSGAEPQRGVAASRCSQPMVVGTCQHHLMRFYYDNNQNHQHGEQQKTQRCRAFIYSGCGGNDNRFTTLEQCRSECMPRGYGAENRGEGSDIEQEVTRDGDSRYTATGDSLSSRSSMMLPSSSSDETADIVSAPETADSVSFQPVDNNQLTDYQYADADYYDDGELPSEYDYFQNTY